MNPTRMASEPSIDLVIDILDESQNTLEHLQTILFDENLKPITTKVHIIKPTFVKLESELRAADSIICAVQDTGKGWPDDPARLATFTGQRSGFPTDLISVMLEKALALTNTISVTLLSEKNGIVTTQIDHYAAIDAVYDIVRQVTSIVRYDIRKAQEQAAA